jgi:phosphoesterase RecJ-like protein
MQKIRSSKNLIIKNLRKANGKIVITSHHNPDGDAIGSMLGLYFILKEIGVDSYMIIPNGIPDYLMWLPGAKEIIIYSKNKKVSKRIIKDAQILFALDYNGLSRLEDMSDYFKNATGSKILIDHHPNPENSFDYYLSDVTASSTSELIFRFAKMLKSEKIVNFNSAICIFTGILTDTGSFSYAISSPKTFNIVSKLIARGVNIDLVQKEVYNNYSEGRMRLLGHSLVNRMKVFPDYNAAFISLTRAELNSFDYKIGDTESLVNYPLSIKNIVFSALFIENTNFVKVSLRSRGDFPVNKVSQEYFQGGGHVNAAGGKSFASLDDTEKVFLEIIEKYKKELTQ